MEDNNNRKNENSSPWIGIGIIALVLMLFCLAVYIGKQIGMGSITNMESTVLESAEKVDDMINELKEMKDKLEELEGKITELNQKIDEEIRREAPVTSVSVPPANISVSEGSGEAEGDR